MTSLLGLESEQLNDKIKLHLDKYIKELMDQTILDHTIFLHELRAFVHESTALRLDELEVHHFFGLMA